MQQLLGGGGPDSVACPVSEDWNYCNGDIAAKFASHQSIPEFANTTGPRMPGLDCGALFLVWKNRSWGDPMSYTGCVISFLAARMENREGRERVC